MRSNVQAVAAKARAESLSYEQFLLDLVEREQDVRRQHRIERALRASHLPLEKTLQTFDRKRLPRKVDAHVNGLLEGTFLQRCENVLAFGPPGSGKTHLLCAIGYELVHADYRVRFRQCSMLVQELLAHRYERGSVMVYQQPALFEGGPDLQRPDDHRCRHRPPCTPLRRPRTRRRTQLPARRIQEARQWIIIRRKWEISETGRSGEGSRYQGRGDRPSQSI